MENKLPKGLRGHNWQVSESMGVVFYTLQDEHKCLYIVNDFLKMYLIEDKEMIRDSKKSFKIFGFEIPIKEKYFIKVKSDKMYFRLVLNEKINDRLFMTKLVDAILKTGNRIFRNE